MQRRRLRPGLLLALPLLLVLHTVAPLPYFLWLRSHEPPITAFQAVELGRATQTRDPALHPRQRSIPVEQMSRNMLLATMALEDDQLGVRRGGVIWSDFYKRAWEWSGGKKQTSGSTIPQQTVKNLLLFRGGGPPRKVIEAPWAEVYARVVPAKRQLELYLNQIEFGKGSWGICEASWVRLRKSPAELTIEEAVSLLQMLPDPKHRKFSLEAHAPVTRKRIRNIGGLPTLQERFGISNNAEDYPRQVCGKASARRQISQETGGVWGPFGSVAGIYLVGLVPLLTWIRRSWRNPSFGRASAT